MNLINFIIANLDTLFAVLFGLQAAAAAIVKLTPTTKDDAIVGKVLQFLEMVAGFLAVKRKA